VTSGNLKASNNGAGPADVSIVCVGTPSSRNGSLQLDYIKRVSEQIGSALKRTAAYTCRQHPKYRLAGTVKETIIRFSRSGPKSGREGFRRMHEPRVPAEGTSIKDYYHPPFTVIGQINKKSGAVVEKLYGTIENAPVIKTAYRWLKW